MNFLLFFFTIGILVFIIIYHKLKPIEKVNQLNYNKHKNNVKFIKLYNYYNNLDNKILKKYKKGLHNLENINYKLSYTPKKLLDDRVTIHINLDNEDYKDSLGL